MAPIFSGSKFGFGRSAAVAIVRDPFLRDDPLESNLVLAMPLNGNYTDYAYQYNGGATPQRTFSTFTGSGGVVEFQSSTYKYYNNALRTYNGSGGAYAYTSNSYDSSEFVFSGDFCIECWLYIDSGASDTVVIFTSSGTAPSKSITWNTGVRGVGSGGSNPSRINAGVGDGDQSSQVWQYGGWHHLAVSRSGTTLYYWYDGTSAGSVTYASTLGSLSSTWLGLLDSNTFVNNINCYMNDIRVYNGVAKYTTTFTPPDKMYLG